MSLKHVWKIVNKSLVGIIATTSITLPHISYAADNSEPYVGYVLYTGNVIADINGITQQTQGAIIVKPDGTSETCATLYDQSALLNKAVSVAPTDFGVMLNNAQSVRLSGVVDAASNTIGSYALSGGVHILDVAACPVGSNHYYTTVSLDRIDGLTISYNDVLYCAVDVNGAVTDLILNDVTGDAYYYGITNMDTTLKENIICSVGQKWKCSSLSVYSLARAVPMQFSPYMTYDIDMDTDTGKLISYDGIYHSYSYASKLNLYGYASNIENKTATINNNTYKLSDNLQVFYKEGLSIAQTSLASVTNGKYKLSCYYDKPENKGGRIRVIVTEKK